MVVGFLYYVSFNVVHFILCINEQIRPNNAKCHVFRCSNNSFNFVLRGIYIVREGAIQGMLTDFQLWIFPIVTALIAVFVWATKD